MLIDQPERHVDSTCAWHVNLCIACKYLHDARRWPSISMLLQQRWLTLIIDNQRRTMYVYTGSTLKLNKDASIDKLVEYS